MVGVAIARTDAELGTCLTVEFRRLARLLAQGRLERNVRGAGEREMLNCKQGDLAVIVRSAAGNEGRIVRCVSFRGYVTEGVIYGGARWNVEPAVPRSDGGTIDHLADDNLRPLRNTRGEDEILRIAGKPRTACTPNEQN